MRGIPFSRSETITIRMHLRLAWDEWFKYQKGVLLKGPRGVDKVIRALRHQGRTARNRNDVKALETVERAHGHFMKNHHRMQYRTLRKACLFIGSGIMEAVGKVLVTDLGLHGPLPA